MSTPVKIIIAFFIAAFLGLILAATAPFHSPGLAGQMQCPEGSSLQMKTYVGTFTQPGETGISIRCEDAQGKMVDSSATETPGFWKLTAIFFVPSLIIVLLIVWMITRLLQHRSPGVYR